MQTSQGEAAGSADPVTLEIVRGALSAVQSEMEALIERTAMSPFIREKKDFHAALFDARRPTDRRVAACRSSSDLIEPIARALSAARRCGPATSTGTTTATPRAARCRTRPTRSSSPRSSRTARLSPSPIPGRTSTTSAACGRARCRPTARRSFRKASSCRRCWWRATASCNDELLRLFYRNSRFPAMVRGDTRASLAAIRLGERRLLELIARFGAREAGRRVRCAAGTRPQRDAARAGCARWCRTASTASPKRIDDDGHGSGPIRIRYRFEVTPERIVLDSTESDDQVRGPAELPDEPDRRRDWCCRLYFLGGDAPTA